MNINELTIGQAKELAAMFPSSASNKSENGIFSHIGEKVIIRTYYAGVWFGKLAEKSGKEVILEDARRMWKWWAKESISLSGVAIYGIKQEESKIVEPVKSVWLEAIEIISLSEVAIKSLEEAPNVKAQ